MYHIGVLPDLNTLADDERTKKILRPLLCPCPDAFYSGLCPQKVKRIVDDFKHNKLCKNYLFIFYLFPNFSSDLQLSYQKHPDFNLLDSNMIFHKYHKYL